MRHLPTLSDVEMHDRFQDGDRVVVRTPVTLSPDRVHVLLRTVDRITRCSLRAIVLNCSMYRLTVLSKDDKQTEIAGPSDLSSFRFTQTGRMILSLGTIVFDRGVVLTVVLQTPDPSA
mgnify:CR=1 FL=1